MFRDKSKFLEKHYRKPIREILRELYIDKGMTMKEVSEELCVSIGTISRWLKRYNIPARKITFI